LTDRLELALLLVGSYAMGCVVGAYYLVRWRHGADLRTLGSGNAGARNAGRVLGPAGFTLSLLVDAGKGALVVWLAQRLDVPSFGVVLAMVGVVVGHVWPVQLRFRGGKGAATALGIMIMFDPRATVILVAILAVALLVTRRFTISGLLAIALAPSVCAYTGHPPLEIAGLTLMAAIIMYAHRTNLLAYRSSLVSLSPPKNQELAQ
jgi:glycerol-3-phosphate acyltransferase PlsY